MWKDSSHANCFGKVNAGIACTIHPHDTYSKWAAQLPQAQDEEVREQVRRFTQERYDSLTAPCSSRRKRLFVDDVTGNRTNESRIAEIDKHS